LTVDGSGQPHIGLYPFLFLGDSIEMHLHRNDEQLADLAGNARCLSRWTKCWAPFRRTGYIRPTPMFATAYHRVVIFECEAVASDDPEVLAAQQQRLMQVYQPDGGHTAVSAEHAMYRGAFREIRALTLAVRTARSSGNSVRIASASELERVINELRKRGRPTDAAAAMHCNGRWISERQ
jgi:hypothetical protein